MNSRRIFLKATLICTTYFAGIKSLCALCKPLPNVLILGDSISIGYTPFVQELLMGKANVVRPGFENGKAENCQGTTYGLQHIQRWLGTTKWDLIHFNFGLHDIKHVDSVSGKNSSNPNDPQQANVKQYKKNLNKIVSILKMSGAKLIFATTTPYPDEVDGPLRKPDMPEKYNSVARRIMNKHGIRINNLHDFVVPRMHEIQHSRNVHFTEAGSKVLARQVAARIEEELGYN